MIVARLENAARYAGIGENIAHALHALQHTDLARRPPGRYDLADDGSVFALVEDYRTKPRTDGIWEAHRRFIDVQFVVAGVEAMGYADLAGLSPRGPYDADKDVAFFDGVGSFLTIPAGTFAIFFPHDAHIPGLDPEGAATAQQAVRKVVIKVSAE
jgi:YhcH/YjgK/YiaL family protein